MNKQQIADEIENFINYYTSDEETAVRMFNTLKDYMDEVYEEARKKVVFRYEREGDMYIVKRNDFPTFKIYASEKQSYIASFTELGYEIHVG